MAVPWVLQPNETAFNSRLSKADAKHDLFDGNVKVIDKGADKLYNVCLNRLFGGIPDKYPLVVSSKGIDIPLSKTSNDSTHFLRALGIENGIQDMFNPSDILGLKEIVTPSYHFDPASKTYGPGIGRKLREWFDSIGGVPITIDLNTIGANVLNKNAKVSVALSADNTIIYTFTNVCTGGANTQNYSYTIHTKVLRSSDNFCTYTDGGNAACGALMQCDDDPKGNNLKNTFFNTYHNKFGNTNYINAGIRKLLAKLLGDYFHCLFCDAQDMVCTGDTYLRDRCIKNKKNCGYRENTPHGSNYKCYYTGNPPDDLRRVLNAARNAARKAAREAAQMTAIVEAEERREAAAAQRQSRQQRILERPPPPVRAPRVPAPPVRAPAALPPRAPPVRAPAALPPPAPTPDARDVELDALYHAAVADLASAREALASAIETREALASARAARLAAALAIHYPEEAAALAPPAADLAIHYPEEAAALAPPAAVNTNVAIGGSRHKRNSKKTRYSTSVSIQSGGVRKDEICNAYYAHFCAVINHTIENITGYMNIHPDEPIIPNLRALIEFLHNTMNGLAPTHAPNIDIDTYKRYLAEWLPVNVVYNSNDMKKTIEQKSDTPEYALRKVTKIFPNQGIVKINDIDDTFLSGYATDVLPDSILPDSAPPAGAPDDKDIDIYDEDILYQRNDLDILKDKFIHTYAKDMISAYNAFDLFMTLTMFSGYYITDDRIIAYFKTNIAQFEQPIEDVLPIDRLDYVLLNAELNTTLGSAVDVKYDILLNKHVRADDFDKQLDKLDILLNDIFSVLPPESQQEIRESTFIDIDRDEVKEYELINRDVMPEEAVEAAPGGGEPVFTPAVAGRKRTASIEEEKEEEIEDEEEPPVKKGRQAPTPLTNPGGGNLYGGTRSKHRKRTRSKIRSYKKQRTLKKKYSHRAH